MLFAEIWTILSIFAQTQSSNRDFPLYYREKILPRPEDKYYICTTKKLALFPTLPQGLL